METLLIWDIWLFYAVNHGWSNSLFDTIMPVITNTSVWRPIYAACIIFLLWKGGVRGRWAAATLIVAVAILDPLSTHALKETIGRLRPYDVLPDVHQLVGSGAGSFPSNHALNNAAAAVILTFFYRRLTWLWWSTAAIIAFSRIYCGVHWPSDVAAGLLLGALAGWGFTKIVEELWKRTTIPRP
jgi:membrane-associated phospholipid phosphatase